MKNEYQVTWKQYKSWAVEGMFSGVKLFFLIVWCLFGGVTLYLGIAGRLYIYCFLSVFCFYRAFLRTVLLAKRQYKLLAEQYKKENWTRSIMFEEDQITIVEENISMKYEYSSVVGIREKKDKIWLYMGDKSVIRLYKSAFVDTDWEKCKMKILRSAPEKEKDK